MEKKEKHRRWTYHLIEESHSIMLFRGVDASHHRRKEIIECHDPETPGVNVSRPYPQVSEERQVTDSMLCPHRILPGYGDSFLNDMGVSLHNRTTNDST